MRKIEYRNVLKPSVEYLEHCGRLMIDSSEMAEFLGVSQSVMTQLASTDRVPARVGLASESASMERASITRMGRSRLPKETRMDQAPRPKWSLL